MNNKTNLRGVVPWLFSLLFILFYFWEAVSYERNYNLSPYPFVGRLVIWVELAIFMLVICWIYRKLPNALRRLENGKSLYDRLSVRTIMRVMVILCLSLRIAAIALLYSSWSDIPSTLEYQIASTVQRLAGEQAVKGSFDESYLIYASRFPSDLFYPLLILPLFIQFCSESYQAVFIANLLFDTVTIVLIGWCANRLCGKKGVLVGMLLFAIWPHQVVRCVMMNTSGFSLMMLTACIYLVVRICYYGQEETNVQKWHILLPFLLGILLEIELWSSGSAIFLVPVWLLLLLFKPRRMVSGDPGTAFGFLNSPIGCVGAAMVTMLIASFIIHPALENVTQRHNPSPYQASGYSLMTGSNLKGNGQWNAEDNYYILHNEDTVAANQEALEVAKQRLIAMTSDKSTILYPEKINYLWRQMDVLKGTASTNIGIIDAYLFGRHRYELLSLLCFAVAGLIIERKRVKGAISVLAGTCSGLFFAALLLMPTAGLYMEIWLVIGLMAILCFRQEKKA
ncbi:MAG: hypothetical protein PHI98_15270 [Eubacteriales bacterium]|nr:hypothetical protein [Eubacteriales bacterium]